MARSASSCRYGSSARRARPTRPVVNRDDDRSGRTTRSSASWRSTNRGIPGHPGVLPAGVQPTPTRPAAVDDGNVADQDPGHQTADQGLPGLPTYRATIPTARGPRRVLRVTVDREGQRPLVATWGQTHLVRDSNTPMQDDPTIWRNSPRTEIVQRLLADTCELCGSRDGVQVHHVKALKDPTDRVVAPNQRGRRRWRRGSGKPWWSAATAITTSTPADRRGRRIVPPELESRMTRKCHVRFEGGRWNRPGNGTSPAAYPTPPCRGVPLGTY